MKSKKKSEGESPPNLQRHPGPNTLRAGQPFGLVSYYTSLNNRHSIYNVPIMLWWQWERVACCCQQPSFSCYPPNGSSCYHGNRRSQNTGLVGQELLFRHFRDGWLDGDKSSRYTKTSAVSGNQKLLIWEQK